MKNSEPTRKDEKVKELIRAMAADFVNKESNRTALVTITNVIISDRGGKADVYFTALPDRAQEATLDFLNRHRDELRDHVRNNSRLGRIPYFEFKIDFGEKNRQRADELLG